MTPDEFEAKWACAVTAKHATPTAEERRAFHDDVAVLVAGSREEQREACARTVLAPAYERDPELVADHTEEIHAARLRRLPIDATPLADEIARLKAERDAAVAEVARHLAALTELRGLARELAVALKVMVQDPLPLPADGLALMAGVDATLDLARKAGLLGKAKEAP